MKKSNYSEKIVNGRKKKWLKIKHDDERLCQIERGETISNLPRIEQIAEVFDMDICELLAYGEEGKIYINNTDNNLTNSFISLGNSSDEVQRLQQIIFIKTNYWLIKKILLKAKT
ncbi:Uncharacterised protein [Rodentibacter pneumotropicus]|uniref:HTH cro/C1-type domain-containing protein n=1 Tax=Rodentibacter pneumotropicus TaxID=758 RepID=A0A448MTR4_9PAST|nr:Uncharacterised protein [Rodentibacter pneumotropicus]